MNEINIHRVAVFLAVYNGMEWLSEQLCSTLKQVDVEVTIFISIDPSSDGSEALCQEFSKKYKNIIILPNVGKFGGAAPNFFRLIKDVDFSKFDYVAFADQDDIWLPNKLLQAHNEIVRHKADAYSSNVTAFWLNGTQVLIDKSQPQVLWDFLFEASGPGCTYVLSKKLALDIQNTVSCNWDEVQGVALHDWFIYAFARANGYCWFIDEAPTMLYRQHKKNQVGVNIGFSAAKYRFNQVMAGWLFDQSLLIAHLVGISDHPFVKSWSNGSRVGYLKLAFRASQCRRRLRDKFLFGLSCVLISFVGRR
jgi:rhamnosyltransferase